MRLQLFNWELILRRTDEPEETTDEADQYGYAPPGLAGLTNQAEPYPERDTPGIWVDGVFHPFEKSGTTWITLDLKPKDPWDFDSFKQDEEGL